jgi:hypothetical protein
MKVMKLIFLILGLLILGLLSYLLYLGAFRSINVEIKEQGGETIVYEEMTGDYSQSAKLMDEIYDDLLVKENIETYKGFGIYYDNPKKVETAQLRSEVGCILEPKNLKSVESLSKKYNVKTFPIQDYLTAEIPFKGKWSIFVGIFRVYPQFDKYAIENKLDKEGEVIEIYDVPNKKIYYRKVFAKL